MRERIQQSTAQLELVREQSQNLLGNLEEQMKNVGRPVWEEMQAFGERLTGALRQELSADVEVHKSRLHSEIEAQRSRFDQMRAQAEAVAGSVEETVMGRLDQMTVELAGQLRLKLETQLQVTSHEVMSRVEGELRRVASAASQSAEGAAADLRRLVEEWNEKLPREEVRVQQLLSDATGKAEDFNLKLDNQIRHFEAIVHDKMLETTGQLKGKMEYAIEGTQARLDARGRDLQAPLEAVAARQKEASEKSFPISKADCGRNSTKWSRPSARVGMRPSRALSSHLNSRARRWQRSIPGSWKSKSARLLRPFPTFSATSFPDLRIPS